MASLAAQKAAEAQAEKDFTEYADKPATDLHKRMAAWVCEKSGYQPGEAKTKAQAFLDGIRLTKFLQSEFQASPENQAVLEERRLAKEEAKAERATAKKAKKTAKAAVEETSEEETPKPAAKKAGKKAAPKPAPEPEEAEDDTEEAEEETEEAEEETPKPAPAPKRRPAKRAKASSKEEAPF